MLPAGRSVVVSEVAVCWFSGGGSLLGGHEFLLSGDHSLDTVVHVLHKVLFGAAEAAAVRDVVGAVVGLGVLTVDTADLDVVLVSDSLEGLHVLGELGELDVDGGAKGGTEVGGAGGDVTEVLVVGELDDLLDGGGTTREALEDLAEVGTLLHGDDAELVLLVDPDQEGLVSVVEDTTAVGPVTVQTAGLKEAVALSKQS